MRNTVKRKNPLQQARTKFIPAATNGHGLAAQTSAPWYPT